MPGLVEKRKFVWIFVDCLVSLPYTYIHTYTAADAIKQGFEKWGIHIPDIPHSESDLGVPFS